MSDKKGNTSWKPASLLDIRGKDPSFRDRIVRKDDANIAKKLKEGWEFVDGTSFSKTEHVDPTGRPDLGKKLTSLQEGHDWVLMRMPEETARARDSYISEETARREMALVKQAKTDFSSDKAPVHGNITIEKRGVATVIE